MLQTYFLTSSMEASNYIDIKSTFSDELRCFRTFFAHQKQVICCDQNKVALNLLGDILTL